MTNDGPEARQVTREMLYEQVWAKPIRTVAAEYGISDVGLAKACDRLNIPRPAVGHWVRLEHGCVFRTDLGVDSGGTWALIPE